MDPVDPTIVWRTDVLPRNTRKALAAMAQFDWLRDTDWYLAGGTALALQVGHRSSVDLDFFTPKKAFDATDLLDHFSPEMWETDILREGTVYGRLHGAKASFIAYPFFVPTEAYRWHGAVRVLAPADIAVMKVIAVSQRGRKRDFVDLYWLATNLVSLIHTLRRLDAQYPGIAHDYHHIIKSLTYFADAEDDPMPDLNFRASWKTIQAWFRREIPSIARELLRLE